MNEYEQAGIFIVIYIVVVQTLMLVFAYLPNFIQERKK